MSETKKELVTKTKEHALEDVFDIEPGTTVLQYEEQVTELVVSDVYDEKDEEIENDLQQIADKALSGYDQLRDEMDSVEGKYLARMAEVSNQFLGRALDAIKEKARLKEHKDKLVQKQKAPPTTVNNNVNVTANDLMKMLRESKPDEAK